MKVEAVKQYRTSSPPLCPDPTLPDTIPEMEEPEEGDENEDSEVEMMPSGEVELKTSPTQQTRL